MSLSNLWLVHIKFLESMTIYTIIFFLISLVNSELLPFLQKWIFVRYIKGILCALVSTK
jgi:hypothetical protein